MQEYDMSRKRYTVFFFISKFSTCQENRRYRSSFSPKNDLIKKSKKNLQIENMWYKESNNLNIIVIGLFLLGETIAFFRYTSGDHILVKTRVLPDYIENLCYEEIVWRQLEFAFFGALTSLDVP